MGRRDERTVSAFHIRILVSSDAEARYIPLLDHEMSEKPFMYPLRLRITEAPVKGDHILMTLSGAAACVAKHITRPKQMQRADTPQEARRVPSGLTLSTDTDWVCPLRHGMSQSVIRSFARSSLDCR